jgi:hypothetical protein
MDFLDFNVSTKYQNVPFMIWILHSSERLMKAGYCNYYWYIKKWMDLLPKYNNEQTIEEQTALENNLFLWSYRWHF